MEVFRENQSVSSDRDGQNIPEEWHSLLTIKCCRAHWRLLSFCGISSVSICTSCLSNSVITKPYYLNIFLQDIMSTAQAYSVPLSLIAPSIKQDEHKCPCILTAWLLEMFTSPKKSYCLSPSITLPATLFLN